MWNRIRGILKYLLFALLAFLFAAILFPFIFKEKVIAFIKEKTNDQLNAEVNFSDASVSFLRSFPSLTLQIDSLTIYGKDQFEGVLLYKAVETNLDVNIPSLFGSPKVPIINSIRLEKPEINIVILDTSQMNYLILKDTTTRQKSYELELKEYKINQGKISYQDNSLGVIFSAQAINHEGAGNFSENIFDVITTTIAEKINVSYLGTSYIKDATLDMKAGININLPENKFTILENSTRLNNLDFALNGYMQLSGDDVVTDIQFQTQSEEFKSLISILPNAYTRDFDKVKTSGKAGFEGFVKGKYNGVKKEYPAFGLHVSVENGYVKYPTLPKDISGVFAKINIAANKTDYSDLSVQIPEFRLKIGEDPVSGSLAANNNKGDQKVAGHLKGTVNLKNVASAYPIENLEELSGKIICDVEFNSKTSDINNENYGAIQFKGLAQAEDIKYKSSGMPLIKFNKTLVNVSPKEINFKCEKINFGKSDVHVDGKIINPLAAFSTEKTVSADFTVESNMIDLNEWNQPASKTTKTNHSNQEAITIPDEVLKNAKILVNFHTNTLLYGDYVINDLSLKGNMAANAIDIRQFNAKIGESDFALHGTALNVYDYLFNHGILDSKMTFSSSKFNANTFMKPTEEGVKTEKPGIIAVPERIRATFTTDISELTYTNLILKDFKGDLEIKNQEVAIKNMETNTLGGKILMDGLYNTNDLKHPDFTVKLDLSKIKFVEAISKIDMLKKAAPVAAYMNGFFNTTLVMKGKLGENMTPDLSTLDASGFIETVSGSIKGFNPMGVLSDKLGMKELKDIKLDNTKNWFEIIQGFVELKEFNKNISGIDVTISGKHGFGQNMDYNFDLVIPREMLKKNKISALGESGLSAIEKEAGKLGINISQGPNIFLNVKMTGNIKSPMFKITPKRSKNETIGDYADSKSKEIISSVKDTLNKELRKKEKELRDTVTKMVNKELDKAKTKAEEAAEKVLDSLKAKAKEAAGNKLDTLAKGIINDSLKKKAEEILNNKANNEVDKIKEKLKDFNPFMKKGKG